jgi:hypothetical protein
MRALVRDETHDELNDASCILLQELGFVLDRWPEIRPVLKTDPENGAWEWDEQTRRYLPAS